MAVISSQVDLDEDGIADHESLKYNRLPPWEEYTWLTPWEVFTPPERWGVNTSHDPVFE